MGNVYFNVNTQASVALIQRLETLHRSALPVAIRGTLNDAAFDVKKRTLEISATNNFVRRAPSFFKKFSGVNRAQGFDVKTMKSEVGMTSLGIDKAEPAVRHMYEQEFGGSIDEGLEYLSPSRVSGSSTRLVKRARYARKENIVQGSFLRKGTTKSRMVAAAYVALREKKQLKIKSGGRNFYSAVTNIRKLTSKKNAGRVVIRSKLLSQSRKGHPSKIKATHFSREAAMLTQPQIPNFFVAQAGRQINKVWK